ncbi:MAG: penicillin-binding protein 2 [Acidobacteria bacterium]|nr:penicillin-binding protein 2 [Acidobacteriota bacterium]
MLKRQRKTTKNSMQTTFTRYMFIVAFFIFWIGAIGVRLVHLQVNQHDKFRKQALGQRRDVVETKMLRGTIFDRNERPIAMSVEVNSLYADPMEIDDVDDAAKKIGAVLKTDWKAIAKRINEGKADEKRFVWVERKIEKEKYDELNENLRVEDLKKYNLPKYQGLYWEKEQKRKYPYKTLAAHMIGFSNSDDVGQAGIELSQEKLLRGDVIKTYRERDRLGRVYDEWGSEEREEPRDIVLTISNSIQFKVEEALAKGVRSVGGKSGKAIVLDPKSGEILAMANYPSFDPNEFGSLKTGSWKNSAIQDNYAPGSVFKLVTYGAALEEKLITPDGEVDCGNGTITIAKHTFNDSHAVGKVTYTKAFAQSSNVGAIKTAMKVGEKTFYKYARDFGFGEKTGIRLPAETTGLLRSPKSWNGDSLASMSIGYEIGVTALQSVAAFATIANDGVKIQPHIVKEIRKADGTIVSTTQPEKVQVVGKETAKELRKMLKQVVLDGTARAAQLNGYTSAGKTGTAWKYDEKSKRVDRNKYIASFIGFAPADDPEIVIAVIVDEPKGSARYGGQVAAPVFREIAEQVLPELNVVPDGVLRDDALIRENENKAKADEEEMERPPITDAEPENSSDNRANETSAPEKSSDPKAAKESIAVKRTKSGGSRKDPDKKKETAPSENKSTQPVKRKT